MGRAQVVQAEAAGIRPTVDMNPILLKPTTDVGSQVIVHGVPLGNMKARDYFAYKKESGPDGDGVLPEAGRGVRHHRDRGGRKPGGDQLKP